MDSNIPTITDFFTGKNIFITGATGFLGKSLIEKFLRSCPDIGTIYILIRPKRGNELKERLKILLNDLIFERIKNEQPSLKMEDKIIPLAGNMMDLNLGLTPEDRKLLTDNVHIIFNVAASVRFDDALTDAVILNVRGTREVCQIALDAKHLVVFMHVSTTFSNCDLFNIKETLYPAKANWKKIIQVAEKCDKHTLSAVTQLYINHMPNTYCFTKQVAEHVVSDMMTGIVATKIFRPSVVTGCFQDEPVKGWIDNFNGPMGVTVAYGKGIMRTVYVGKDNLVDYIPIDVVTKSLIVSTWDLAVRKNKSHAEVINCANNYKASWLVINSANIGDIATRLAETVLPFNNILWPPTNNHTHNLVLLYIETVFLMLIPSILLDGFLKLFGKKPILKKLVRKMYAVQLAIRYFVIHNWIFENDNLFALQKKIKADDKANWDYEFLDYDMTEFIYHSMMGCRRYLLNEKDETLPEAILHLRKMQKIQKIVWTFLYILIAYVMLKVLLFKFGF